MKLWPKVRILLISFFFLAETIAAPTVAVTAWNNRILSGEQLSAALAPPISSENCQNVKRRQRSDAIFPSFFFRLNANEWPGEISRLSCGQPCSNSADTLIHFRKFSRWQVTDQMAPFWLVHWSGGVYHLHLHVPLIPSFQNFKIRLYNWTTTREMSLKAVFTFHRE